MKFEASINYKTPSVTNEPCRVYITKNTMNLPIVDARIPLLRLPPMTMVSISPAPVSYVLTRTGDGSGGAVVIGTGITSSLRVDFRKAGTILLTAFVAFYFYPPEYYLVLNWQVESLKELFDDIVVTPSVSGVGVQINCYY